MRHKTLWSVDIRTGTGQVVTIVRSAAPVVVDQQLGPSVGFKKQDTLPAVLAQDTDNNIVMVAAETLE